MLKASCIKTQHHADAIQLKLNRNVSRSKPGHPELFIPKALKKAILWQVF
jgi:hypothetical protein